MGIRYFYGELMYIIIRQHKYRRFLNDDVRAVEARGRIIKSLCDN